MSPQKFAFYGGIVMVVMGVLSLIPALSVAPYAGMPVLRIEASYGLFLGFFPMNIISKVVLMAFGTAGILVSNEAADSDQTSVIYARAICVTMGGLAILGMFRATNTLAGFWPLFGGEVFAHAIFAILGGYFGYITTFGGSHHQPFHRA